MKVAHELTVIIVSYNTQSDLKNCLASIFNSSQSISFKVCVVDNNSTDSSPDMVASSFPQVALIRSTANLGFAKANNLVLRRLDTPFALLLNPDTIVLDHAFDGTIDFLGQHPRAGMATCKLVTANGSLDLACRRSFPTPFDGFCRAAGLSKLFPKSRLFARYNLTYLDENEISEVEAINGAFMMVRGEALRDVGLMDEDYFMYMEDLDWCLHFKQKKWACFYVPTHTVIHLKGQSGKKCSTKMILEFFKSMEYFYRKNCITQAGPLSGMITLIAIRLWGYSTLLVNSIRPEKRVTP